MNKPVMLNEKLAAGGDEALSPLAQRTLERAASRQTYLHDLAPILGLAEPYIVAIRVPTHGEQLQALLQAHRYVALYTANAPEDVKRRFDADEDVTDDSKAAAVIQTAVRMADGVHPVWPSVQFVSQNHTPDQLAAILNLIVRARAVEAGGQPEPSPEVVERLLVSLANSDADKSAAALAVYPREALAQLLVLAASKLVLERRLAAAVQDHAGTRVDEHGTSA